MVAPSTHSEKCGDPGRPSPQTIQRRRRRRDTERSYPRSEECILGNDFGRGRHKGLEKKGGFGKTPFRIRSDEGQGDCRLLQSGKGGEPSLFYPEIWDRVSQCSSLPGVLGG